MATTQTEVKEEVKIPAAVELTLQKSIVHVKGPKGTLSRDFIHPKIILTKQENTLAVSCTDAPHKKEKALVGTIAAHVNNMIQGVTEGFEYKLKTVFSHFPIKTSIEGDMFVIQNFLGERSPRKAKILKDVKIVIQAEMITVTGSDIEHVGQTAANIERATKIKNRDVRVFQDGVYIISKAGGKQ